MKKMKVNIWSDVRCPFCYIGKVKFERALQQFAYKNEIEVNWKSFQLEPDLKTQPNENTIEHFSIRKRISKAQAAQMFQQVNAIAEEIGLNFNLDQTVVANSFMAHRFIQYAQSKGLGNEAEEALFIVYFIDCKNIDDIEVLLALGKSIGIEEKELNEILQSGQFSDKVNEDIKAAQDIGINSVPFFVFNDKYSVSGAQSSEVFLQTIEQAWMEFAEERITPDLIIAQGQQCDIDGNCN